MLDTVFRILKITVIVAVCGVFMVAINSFLAFIGSLIFGTVIGEFFGILSCCMPFDALSVFGSLMTACTAILAFLIAKKIFDLTSWGINSV